MPRSISFILLALLFSAASAEAANSSALRFTSPEMDDVINLRGQDNAPDSARVKAIREAGLSVGASAGFASQSKVILGRYCLLPEAVECATAAKEKSQAMDGIFMFRPLMDERGFLPPVITEVSDSVEVSANKMKISGKVYRIDRPARFVQGVMTWRDYLTVGLEPGEVEVLPRSLIPKTSDEKKAWADGVRDGWKLGYDRALEVFQANIDRLKADYLGMLRYKRLLALGLIKAPVVGHDLQTVVISDNERVQNLESSTIINPAVMERSPSSWRAGLVVGGQNGK